jgi:anti-sigma factor RsiW
MSFITCKELIAFLDDYVEEALPPARKDEFESHLELCASCVEYLRGYRAAIHMAKATGRDPDIDTLPADVLAEILAALPRN